MDGEAARRIMHQDLKNAVSGHSYVYFLVVNIALIICLWFELSHIRKREGG